MSAQTGITVCRLSKIENGRATLSYPALVQLSDRLGISPAALFANSRDARRSVKGRLSTGQSSSMIQLSAGRSNVQLLCTDLRHKTMTPRLVTLRARTIAEAGGLSTHTGEEFLFVLQGCLEMHTECYAPTALASGDCIYFDASMGHACTVAPGCDEATLLSIRDADPTSESSQHASDL